MKITYRLSQNEWHEYPQFIQGLVQEYSARTICDIGGGANPILPLEFIQAHNLDCTVLDISSEELEKAPKGYKKLVQDIEAVDFPETGQFNLIVTKMMAEHVRNGRLFHKNIYSLLKPGGFAVHYFPTLYALPYLVNKLTPEWLSSLLLDIFLPRDRYQTAKFPAYYSWTYGPTPSMLKMLKGIGYEIIEFKGFFGTTYYSRIPIVRNIHKAYTVFLSKHPNPYLTSWAQVILCKPMNKLKSDAKIVKK